MTANLILKENWQCYFITRQSFIFLKFYKKNPTPLHLLKVYNLRNFILNTTKLDYKVVFLRRR